MSIANAMLGGHSRFRMLEYDRLSRAGRFMQRYLIPHQHAWSARQYAEELALANEGQDLTVISELRRIELRRMGLNIPA